MKISQIFPSKYLTAADLNGKSFTLTIKRVTLEEMQTHDNKKVQKPVCWFEKAQKGFVMNSTNAYIVVALYGDDTDGWTGRRITLYPTQVKAFGKMQDCIRVREEIPAQPKPTAQAAQVEEQSGLDDDEDVTDFDAGDSLDITIDPETGEIVDGDALFVSTSRPLSASGGRSGGDDAAAPASRKDKVLSQLQMTRLQILGSERHGRQWDQVRPQLVQEVTGGAITSSKELTPQEADVLIKQLEAELKHARNGKVAA